jgi:hypothetical protein
MVWLVGWLLFSFEAAAGLAVVVCWLVAQLAE